MVLCRSQVNNGVRGGALIRPKSRSVRLVWLSTLILAGLLFMLWPLSALADPYPPYWNDGAGPAVHYPPVQWPSEPVDPSNCRGLGTCGAWKPYTRFGVPIADARAQDSSNGGTSPQNYVNVTSGCVDQSLPSIYTAYDAASNTLFFRWRVEQAANTYATGPSAGNYGSTDPWSSALWTVFFDLSGSGYRDLAAHLDGSSGNPGMAIDQIAGIWANESNSQSLDYLTDPAIHLLSHNPTAFVDQATNRILNFQNGLNPSPNWPNGSSETAWNYGTTRARTITRTGINGATCNEYFVDYQIPLSMLDASPLGGPRVTGDTPLSMLFCTANSLNNPLQKDCVYLGPWTSDPSQPAPFGDFFTPKGGTLQQPLVDSVTAAASGPTALTAKTKDALKLAGGKAQTSVSSADFYYYYDANGDGQPNDGNVWTLAAAGSQASLNRWTATWDSCLLPRGQFLIGVQAVDDAALNADGNVHRTFSYLSPDQVALLSPASGELDYANLAPAPGVVYATMVNTCGAPPPYVTQSVSAGQVTAGGQVQITVIVHNTGLSALPISSISNILPPDFSYGGTVSQSLGTLSDSPIVGATGAIQWTFSSASVPAGDTRALVFAANAPTIAGVYNNSAVASSAGDSLSGDPLQIAVGSPRLNIANSVSVTSANPGDQVVSHFTYSNDSTANVTGVTIQDTLPEGFSYVSAAGDPSYDPGSHTLTWNIGALTAGDGPFSLEVTGTITSPFSALIDNPLISTATIRSDQTGAASADATIFVNAPRPALHVQISADKPQVTAGSDVVFTLSYTNVGDAPATNVTLDDPIPDGFIYVSATAPGTYNGGAVHWAIGTVEAGVSASVQVTLQAANPYTASDPQTHTVTISSDEGSTAAGNYAVGVTQSGPVCATYYFRNSTTDVGYDSSQRTAGTSTPTGTGDSVSITTLLNQQYSEVARFYQDPAAPTDLSFASANINTNFYIDRQNGNGITIRATVYDYDSATGTRTSLGQNTNSFQGSQKGLYTFSVTASGTLRRGHRLLWVFEVKSDNNNATDTIQFQFGGTVSNQFSAGTTAANSNGNFCTSAPANLMLDNRVPLQPVQPNDSLQYAIHVANTGGTSATATVITETVPAGVTFVDATLDGATVTPATIEGRQYTFSVQSTGQASGVMAAGTSSLLVINTTVDRPLAAGITSLVNNVSLGCDQTASVSDSVTTDVSRPRLSINETASQTTLASGDTVSYTITVLNSGTGAATGVTIHDLLPGTGYFAYKANTATLNGIPVGGPTGNDLSVDAGSVEPGGTAVVAFQMQVASSGIPDGLSPLDNTSTVSNLEDSDNINSQPVTVTVTGNPNLSLSMAASSADPWLAESLVTYTLTVRNTGSADATRVMVLDPIPANTTYLPGTMQVDDAGQTDANDADIGYFDTINNRVTFSFVTLPSHAASTLRFAVRINSPLANGLNTVANVATASAANAAARSAGDTGQASASPNLSLSMLGPENVAYPVARLTSAANAVTVLQVEDAAQLSIGRYVLISGQIRQIIAMEGQAVTVDAPLTADAGASVISSITYSLNYSNSGSASTTDTMLVDTLPEGATFVNATDEGVQDNSAVTWSLGTVPAGATGSVQLTIFPAGAGSAANNVSMSTAETPVLSRSMSTTAGGLRIRKSADTPVVQQTLAGTNAKYTVQIDNTAAVTATGVTVRDILPNGATYVAGSATLGGNATRNSVNDPEDGTGQPTWGTWSIPPSGSLSITFGVHIAAEAGPASYSNFVEGNSSNLPVIPFDGLASSTDDLRVTEPIVALTSTVSVSTIEAGGHLQYTLAASNNGDATATGVEITDTLPAGFAYSSMVDIQTSGTVTRINNDSPAQGAASPSWGAWAIAPGSAVSITFDASAGALPGIYADSPSATADNTLIPDLSSEKLVTVTGVDQAPSFIAASPNSTGFINTDYPAYTFVASGYPPPTYTVSAGTLPAGMTLDEDGKLSGTPSSTGSSSFAVRASNRAGQADTGWITITINQAPSFSAASPSPTGLVNYVYSPYTFVAAGYPPPTYTVSAGALPNGLTLDGNTGQLSGTPTVPGSYSFAVQATNCAGHADTGWITITIDMAPSFIAETPTNGAIGKTYSYRFLAIGNPEPTYALATGSLPDGLSVSEDGYLTGIPTTPGTFTFTVKAINRAGETESHLVTLVITSGTSHRLMLPLVASRPSYQLMLPLIITTDIAPSVFEAWTPVRGTVGVAYSHRFQANGSPAPAYTLATGSLPDGLTLGEDGYLTGVPTKAGTFTFTLRATNRTGEKESDLVSVTINPSYSHHLMLPFFASNWE